MAVKETKGHLQKRLGEGALLAHVSLLVGTLMKPAAGQCGLEQSSHAGAPPDTT